MQHYKTMLTCIAATLILSCSKKDDDKKTTPTPVTPTTDKLIGSWKTIAAVADRPVYHWNTLELVTDLWDREEDCRRDDLLTFKADNSYVADEGATKCTASAPQIKDEGTWKQSGNILTVVEDGIDYDFTIEKLDDSSLVMTARRFYIINGDTTFFYATTTMIRQ
jgi:hypothetical protein